MIVFRAGMVRVSVLSSYDPVSRSIGIENGFDCLHPAPKTWLADNILRVQVGNSGKYVPGSLFVMRHYNYEMHCFSIRQSRHITFEDINLYSCAGIGFIADGVQYGQFRRVRVAPPENEPRRAHHLYGGYPACLPVQGIPENRGLRVRQIRR